MASTLYGTLPLNGMGLYMCNELQKFCSCLIKHLYLKNKAIDTSEKCQPKNEDVSTEYVHSVEGKCNQESLVTA